MAKRINELLKFIPKNETVCLTFDNSNIVYIVVRANSDGCYYLYEKVPSGYKYMKSRKDDPCFPECY